MIASPVPHWTEDDGTEVWLVAGDDASGPLADLTVREDEARQGASAGAVLGANADARDAARVEQLLAAGYEPAFSMVTLVRDTATPVARRAPEVDVRRAVTGDASAMHALTRAVWEGRRWFVLPSLERYRSWLERSDLSLFLLARDGEELVGYVAGECRDDVLHLEDVQTHPENRRRGIASELIARVLEVASARGVERAELVTEGGDPAGARSLYESIGFTLRSEALRFRKPVT